MNKYRTTRLFALVALKILRQDIDSESEKKCDSEKDDENEGDVTTGEITSENDNVQNETGSLESISNLHLSNYN